MGSLKVIVSYRPPTEISEKSSKAAKNYRIIMVIGSISSLVLFLVEDTSIVYLPLVSKVSETGTTVNKAFICF